MQVVSAQSDSLASGVYNVNIQSNLPKVKGQKAIINGSTFDLASLNIVLASYNKGSINIGQANDSSEKLIIIKQGQLTVTFHDSIKTVGAGSVVFIIPNDKLTLRNADSKLVSLYVLSFISKKIRPVSERSSTANSLVRDWKEMFVKTTEKSDSRPIFDISSGMLERIETHATALNPLFESHAPHKHRTEELIIMVSGKGQIQIENTFHKVFAGDMIFLGSNSMHAMKNVGIDQCRYFAIQWKSSP